MNYSKEEILPLFEENVVLLTDTFQPLLNKLAFRRNNDIYFDYKILKVIGNELTFQSIINHIHTVVKGIFEDSPFTNIVVNLKSLALKDVDKFKNFICNLIQIFSDEYPDRLQKCYLFKTPGIFSQIYNIISFGVDKETRQKVQIVK